MQNAEQEINVAAVCCHNECAFLQHCRVCQRGVQTILGMKNKGLANGMELVECKTCVCCLEPQTTNQPFSKQPQKKTKEVLELVYTDVCGPLPPTISVIYIYINLSSMITVDMQQCICLLTKHRCLRDSRTLLPL